MVFFLWVCVEKKKEKTSAKARSLVSILFSRDFLLNCSPSIYDNKSLSFSFFILLDISIFAF